MNTVSSRLKVLSRDEIKYIAMFTMLLNHISNVFMAPGGFTAELMLDIGYFTAPVMCFFLVEGFHYTRSKRRYALRLAAFAMISEVPYCLALTESGIIEFCGLNMMFTLLICFGVICAATGISSLPLRTAAIAALTILTVVSDWALLGALFTLLFIWAGDSDERRRQAFTACALLFGLTNFAGGIGRFPLRLNALYSLGSMAGPALAGLTIVYLYNGRRSERCRSFSKWFFYIFYPLHLLVLGLMRIAWI